jgi:hypothetical protein
MLYLPFLFLCLALLLVSTALISIGSCCIRDARWKAEAIAQQVADLHPVRRFFFPLRFFRSESFVWSIRLAGAGAIFGALILIVYGVRAVSHPM